MSMGVHQTQQLVWVVNLARSLSISAAAQSDKGTKKLNKQGVCPTQQLFKVMKKKKLNRQLVCDVVVECFKSDVKDSGEQARNQ